MSVKFLTKIAVACFMALLCASSAKAQTYNFHGWTWDSRNNVPVGSVLVSWKITVTYRTGPPWSDTGVSTSSFDGAWSGYRTPPAGTGIVSATVSVLAANKTGYTFTVLGFGSAPSPPPYDISVSDTTGTPN
jgi:hypothetical protein